MKAKDIVILTAVCFYLNPFLLAQDSSGIQRAYAFSGESFAEVSASISFLNQPVSLALENVTVEEALGAIAEAAGFTLAYSSNVLSNEKRVSYALKDVSVKEAVQKVSEGAGVTFLASKNNRRLILMSQEVQTSETGSIAGTVTDGSTGDPLIGANVVVEGTGLGRSTNEDGEYVINNVPEGEQTITADYIGYSSSSQTITVSGSTTLDLNLQRSAIGLDEVTVTAQRIEQNLQVVPIAVRAFSGDFLQNRQAVDMEQVVMYTPGLNITTAARTLSQPVMRGGSSDEDAPGVDLAVGLFVDEIYLGRNIDFSFDLFDLERVEVLRGPQGTLFGRNVTGGLINIKTKNPTTDEVLGRGEVIFGENNRFDIRGALNVPIVDDLLATRIVVSSRNADGAIPNANGPDLLQDDQDSFRGKLLYTPNDDITFLLTGHHLRDKSIGVARDIIGFGENLLTELASIIDLDKRKANIDAAGAYDRTIWGLSGLLDLHIGFGDLTFISAWHENRSDLDDIDVDGTPELILGGPSTNLAKQFTQEIRHTYTSDNGSIDWIGGLYYLNVDFARTEFVNQIPFASSFLNIIGVPPIGGPFGPSGFFDQRIETNSYAVFGQFTYAPPMVEGLRLTFGGRYTNDEKKGYTADSGVIDLFNVDVSDDWSAFTPKFVIGYRLNEKVFSYFSATRGFKSGGFGATTTQAEALEGFDPEYVWSYEFGLKSRFLEDRLQANIAMYKADYTDLQFRSGTVGTSSFVGNAGEGSTKGVESEFQFLPVENINLFLNYTYQDGKYNELVIGTTDFSGNDLPLTPEHSLSLGGEFRRPLRNIGDLIFMADYQYKSKAYLDPENSAGAVQEVDGIINASISLKFLDSKARISLFGNNLTDEIFITRANSLGVFLGQVDFDSDPPFAQVMAGSFNEPRRMGVSLLYEF
jgi:iron complex outermembrane receptor protein|tara:strand:+ start:2431 stop:5196 length:2766 start_codon:yes stop_codon:yes gene_type:complete